MELRPKHAEAAEITNVAILDPTEIEQLQTSYFELYCEQVESPTTSEFNQLLVMAISGDVAIKDDEDYLKLLQVGFYDRSRLRWALNYAKPSVLGNDRRESHVSTLFGEFLYKGVSERIKQSPDFESKFVNFAAKMEEELELSHGSYVLWGSMMQQGRHLSSLDKTSGSSAWNDITLEIQKQRIRRENRRLDKRTLERVEGRKGTPDNPSREYVFSPFIFEKDTGYLLEIAERLEEASATEVFGFPENGDVLEKWGYDLFTYILQSAGKAGWRNGEILSKTLSDLPKRDLPHHSILIHLSNLVVKSLNRDNSLGVKLRQLRPTDIENVTEAIDRCMFVVFERGQRSDSDPINFLVSADIANKVFISVMSADAKKTQERNSETEPNNAYVDLLRGSKGHHAEWKRWKQGYGLIT